MKIKLDKDARIPTRAHSTDAGLDLYARDTQIIPAKESAVFDTGVHVELPEGEENENHLAHACARLMMEIAKEG